MGCGSQLLTMISILIITLLMMMMMMILSSQRTHILTLMNAAKSDMYFMNQNGKFQVEKISGIDENEMKQAMIVEKFRSLLGLKSFHKRVHSKSNDDSSEFLSPSPSPAPSPAPSPSPLLHLHPHLHHPKHHWNQQVKKPDHDEDRGRDKRVIILVAVLVSLGVAALVGVFGLIFFCRKYTKQKKKPKRTTPLFTSNKGTTTCHQNSSSKVSLNPGLDLFYLDALGEDIEHHACSLRKTCDDNNVSSSSNKEVVSVHQEMELVKGESVIDDGNFSCGDKIISEHCHSSDDDDNDDESFHSFVDSQSNNVRLSNASNASACSLSDTQSLSPQNNHQFPSSPQKTTLNTFSHHLQFSPKHEDKEVELEHEHEDEIEITVQCSNTSTSSLPPPPPSPPPPPPPTPPLQMPLFSLHSLTSSSRVSSHSPLSDTFSASNLRSPEKESLSPSPSNPIKSSPSSIPPPPCPPPFLKGNSSNSAKTPPPPPSHFPQFTPLGKDGSPLPKLKPLHWDKVRAAPNRTMVWDKLRSSSFELDEEMIESLFGYNLQNSMKNDEAKSKTPSPSQHVLDPKRLQNITILSKALNATAEQVCEALMQGKGLSLQQLEALVKMVPTKEEESKLLNYKGDINELGSAEKFVRAMLSVPFAFQRVESLLYKETFDDEVVHLRNSFSMLEEACKELRSSRLFLKLLEAVLKTGNRMNVGTIRGGAKAFKLDALLKLSDVKGTDGKTTLLHFVVQEIVRSEGIRVSDSIMGKISQKSNKNRTEEEKEEDYRRMGLELVSGLSTELYNVKKTATIDLDVLASSVSNLSDGMTRLQHLLDKELYEDERSKNFVHSMKFFLNYVGRNLKELRGDEDRVLARVKEIAEYFHGDVISKEDANPLRIFVIVRDFMGMLDNVCKELRKSKVARTPNPLAPFR